MSKTKYGKSFYNLKKEQYNRMLNSFSIRSIKLYKNRVYINKKTKKVHKILSRKLISKTKDNVGNVDLINKNLKISTGFSHFFLIPINNSLCKVFNLVQFIKKI